LRIGENADSPRYTRALVESARCPHCLLLAIRARVLYFFLGGV